MAKGLVIVEADPGLANNLENALKEHFDIHIALNGKDGLNTIKQVKPHVAIIDFFLPELNGFQLCSQLKAGGLLAGINIILLVDSADIGNRFVSQFNIKQYFLKPYNIDAITTAVSDLLPKEQPVPAASEESDDIKFDDEESLKLLDDIFADMGIGEGGKAAEPEVAAKEELPMVEENPPQDEKTEILSGGTTAEETGISEGIGDMEINKDLLGDLDKTLETLNFDAGGGDDSGIETLSADETGLPDLPDLEDIKIEEPAPAEEAKAEELPEMPDLGDIKIEEPAPAEEAKAEELPEIPDLEDIKIDEPAPAEETKAEELPEIPDLGDIKIEESAPAEEAKTEELPGMPDIEDIKIEEPAPAEEAKAEELPGIPDIEDIKIEEPAPAEEAKAEELPEIPAEEPLSVSEEPLSVAEEPISVEPEKEPVSTTEEGTSEELDLSADLEELSKGFDDLNIGKMDDEEAESLEEVIPATEEPVQSEQPDIPEITIPEETTASVEAGGTPSIEQETPAPEPVIEPIKEEEIPTEELLTDLVVEEPSAVEVQHDDEIKVKEDIVVEKAAQPEPEPEDALNAHEKFKEKLGKKEEEPKEEVQKFEYSGTSLVDEKQLSFALGQMLTKALEKQIAIALQKIDFTGIISEMVQKMIADELTKNLSQGEMNKLVADKIKESLESQGDLKQTVQTMATEKINELIEKEGKTIIESKVDKEVTDTVKKKIADAFKNLGSMFGPGSGS